MNQNLEKQMKSICKLNAHNDSFQTRKTYRIRMNRFLEWASLRGLQKLQNISNKQMSAYINQELDRGISERTLKSTLCAIRHYNRVACLLSKTESRLNISNEVLGIGGKSTFQYREGVSEDEYFEALKTCANDFEMISAIRLGYILGLRSNEIFNLRMYELRDAIRSENHQIHIDHGTKGGRKRVVEFDEKYTDELTDIFESAKKCGKRLSDKVLCKNEKGECKRQLARWHNFWSRYGARIANNANSNRATPLSAHCLRRQYSRNMFNKLLEDGMNEKKAASNISEWLGHGRSRKDITALYLGVRV